MVGIVFILIYLLVGLIRIVIRIPSQDRIRFLKSMASPATMLKNAKDIINDCLLHVKIFKRNILLGYMHASIALGWFMLIVIGHIEVALYIPQRNGLLYYPVFFRYFVKQEGELTLKGAFFFFLMDFFLLMVLSGIGLAIYKRFRSRALGMRRTTKPCLADRIALICLWSIFPLRLLAESFTAGIAGGSFLTKPMHWIFARFLSNDLHILPTWWAYSFALGIFFLALPFSRYMHIPTEALLIMLRNAGIKSTHPRKGYAEAEIYSCSGCGLCIDACPMNIQKKNLTYSSVYMIRFLRRNNPKKSAIIADKCLMCGKCVTVCPVGVESCNLKKGDRASRYNTLPYDYRYLGNDIYPTSNEGQILYFAGCMTHLTPSIIKGMEEIFQLSGSKYMFADKEGGLCCGRPLLLAGREDAAKEVIARNTQMILESGCSKVVLSCPICLKVFREEYKLQGIGLMHHTQFINGLIKDGKIKVKKGDEKLVYHNPCELGRGCGIYKEPLEILQQIGELRKGEKEGKESICCGGSLGSLTLNYEDRNRITQGSLNALTSCNPDKIITSCPLCLKTFSQVSPVPVVDIAQIVKENTYIY